MTAAEMVASLRLRMNDPSATSRLADASYYIALSDSQIEIAEVLPVGELFELQKDKLGIASGDTGVSAVGVRYTILDKTNTTLFTNKAIRFVAGAYRHSVSSEEYFFDEILTTDRWQLSNNLMYSGYTSAVVNDRDNKFYIYPALPSGHVIDIHYIREPLTISGSQDCELKSTLHRLVVRCAQFILEKNPEQVNLTLQKYNQELAMEVNK